MNPIERYESGVSLFLGMYSEKVLPHLEKGEYPTGLAEELNRVITGLGYESENEEHPAHYREKIFRFNQSLRDLRKSLQQGNRQAILSNYEIVQQYLGCIS